MSRRARRRGTGPHGVVAIDKPEGPTSAGVLDVVKRQLGSWRAGHAGTLDPAASGVLVVLLGEATKLSDWVMAQPKAYRAVVELGRTTDTLDREGAVVAEQEVPAAVWAPERLEAALAAHVGDVMQRPPAYSALKRGGKRLMDLARAGEEVIVEPRPVTCYGLTLLEIAAPRLVVDVACSKGYYVRAMARDVGATLGVPAHLAGLRRTQVGPFGATQAIAPDAVTLEHVLPIQAAVPPEWTLTVTSGQAQDLGYGRPIAATDERVRVLALDEAGVPVAMLERDERSPGDPRWRVQRGFHLQVDNPQGHR